MALKFLDASGQGYTSDAIRAINYMTMMRTVYGVNVRVANASWGGGGYDPALSAAIASRRPGRHPLRRRRRQRRRQQRRLAPVPGQLQAGQRPFRRRQRPERPSRLRSATTAPARSTWPPRA